jgi:hypothetical protein
MQEFVSERIFPERFDDVRVSNGTLFLSERQRPSRGFEHLRPNIHRDFFYRCYVKKCERKCHL